MKLVNLIPLKEIDFRNQDAFDSYNKQHKLRPDTKVTIAGKPTTAGKASQKTGSSVFGKDSGGDVFGGNTPKSDMGVDSVVYNKRTKTVGIVRLADERGETKTDADGNVNTSDLEPYNPMKYPHQKDAKVAPSTKKEVDTRSLWKPFAQSAGGAKEKSITDIKADKQVDVSMVSKSILPNLRLADGSGYPDKDAAELKQRLDKGDNGVYTRTSPHGGNIVFKDGTKFEVFRPHDAKKTKSTKIYASKR
jgi:hypothetical protein